MQVPHAVGCVTSTISAFLQDAASKPVAALFRKQVEQENTGRSKTATGIGYTMARLSRLSFIRLFIHSLIFFLLSSILFLTSFCLPPQHFGTADAEIKVLPAEISQLLKVLCLKPAVG